MARRSFLVPCLLVLCAVAFALRVYRLAEQSFWFDEGLTVDLALAPPGYVLATIDRPPLYYLQVHSWIGVTGPGPFTFRFLSAVWGTLAVALVYRLGRQLAGRRAGAWAAGLAAFSPFYVYYSQEARTYTLTLALALLSTCALLAWLATRRRRWLVLHVIATLACFYTHYTALLLPLAQVGFVAVARRPSARVWLGWLGAQGFAGLAFLPWPLSVAGALPDLALPGGTLPPVDPVQHAAHFLWTTLVEWSTGRTLAGSLAAASAFVVLFLVLLGAGSPIAARRARRALWLALGLPLLALLLLPRTGTYFSPKYLMLATPAFYLLAAFGLETLRRAAPRLWFSCLAFVVFSWCYALGDWYLYPHVKVAELLPPLLDALGGALAHRG